jgi:hypothetical protein
MGHMTGTPTPVRERNPQVPPEWEALCMHMMEKSRDARFQSVSEIAQVLFDLPRHAEAYSSYLTARSTSGHSGHTMRLDASPDPQETATRPTLHGLDTGLPPVPGSLQGGEPALPRPSVQYFTPAQLEALATMSALPPMQAPPLATSSYVVAPTATNASASGAYEGPPTGDTGAGMAACYALATEARHSRFLATLLVRPPGRWANVAELCSTSNTAPPAALPPQPLFCTWLDHPWADPGMVAVIFVSLNDGSNTVALCRRVSW